MKSVAAGVAPEARICKAICRDDMRSETTRASAHLLHGLDQRSPFVLRYSISASNEPARRLLPKLEFNPHKIISATLTTFHWPAPCNLQSSKSATPAKPLRLSLDTFEPQLLCRENVSHASDRIPGQTEPSPAYRGGDIHDSPKNRKRTSAGTL